MATDSDRQIEVHEAVVTVDVAVDHLEEETLTIPLAMVQLVAIEAIHAAGVGVPLDAAAGTTLAAHHIAALLRRDVVVMAGEIVHPEKVEDEEMLVDVVVEDGAGATAAEAGAGHTLVVEAGSVVEEGVRRERVYGLIRSMDIDCSNLGGHLGRQLVLVVCTVRCTIGASLDFGLARDSEQVIRKSMRSSKNCRISMGSGTRTGIWQLNNLHQLTESMYQPLGRQVSAP